MVETPSTLRTDELPYLTTFVMAAEHGSFTAAAARLGITQAAVSQRIAALEQDLRIALFSRRAGRISLTEAGQRLYAYAREIVELHGKARADLGGGRLRVSGDLPIAASSVPGECFLPALLTGFGREHPEVQVRATVGDSGSVLGEVENGRAALGLTGQRPDKSVLEARPIGSDCLVLIVPPGHRWAKRRSVTLEALMAEPMIVREPGSGSRSALEKGLERAGTSLIDFNTRLELGSNAAIKDAVERGLGVAFLSGFAVRKELASNELHAVGVRRLSLSRQFYLVYHRHRPLTAPASLFAHFVEAHPIGHAPSR